MQTAFLAGGQGALDLTIDFASTTQYNQSFALKGQSQDGAAEGNLVGLDVGDDGLIVQLLPRQPGICRQDFAGQFPQHRRLKPAR